MNSNLLVFNHTAPVNFGIVPTGKERVSKDGRFKYVEYVYNPLTFKEDWNSLYPENAIQHREKFNNKEIYNKEKKRNYYQDVLHFPIAVYQAVTRFNPLKFLRKQTDKIWSHCTQAEIGRLSCSEQAVMAIDQLAVDFKGAIKAVKVILDYTRACGQLRDCDSGKCKNKKPIEIKPQYYTLKEPVSVIA